MRRIASILLASALTFSMIVSLVGCEGSEGETTAKETTTGPVVTVVTPEETENIVSDDAMTTGNVVTPEEKEKVVSDETNTGIVETTVDGYVTDMDEIPEEFFAQCEEYGKSVVFDHQDTMCFDATAVEYFDVKNLDAIKGAYWYFVTRDAPEDASSAEGSNYFATKAHNALCFLYECSGTTRFSGKSAKGWCYVVFDDIMGDDGVLKYVMDQYVDRGLGCTDLAPAKSVFEDAVTSYDFKVNGSPITHPNYS